MQGLFALADALAGRGEHPNPAWSTCSATVGMVKVGQTCIAEGGIARGLADDLDVQLEQPSWNSLATCCALTQVAAREDEAVGQGLPDIWTDEAAMEWLKGTEPERATAA